MLDDMGARMLVIPAGTTDRLQPLDVNFNSQLKILYNRIIEEAHYQDMVPQVTSREGIINLQSVLHKQLTSKKYVDMIKYAWHNTDAMFNISELSKHPPAMVHDIQFNLANETNAPTAIAMHSSTAHIATSPCA